ncbi:MAG TPA: YtxH domain-containing protein [Longimicrobiales bacterium]
MYYGANTRTFNFLAGLALGVALGGGVVLFTAPRSGRRMRRRLVRAVSGARDDLGGRWDDLADDVRAALSAGRRRFSF